MRGRLFTEVLIIYVRAKVLPDIVDRSERPDSEFDAVPVGSLYATEYAAALASAVVMALVLALLLGVVANMVFLC